MANWAVVVCLCEQPMHACCRVCMCWSNKLDHPALTDTLVRIVVVTPVGYSVQASGAYMHGQ
jgi:hypothetical protein